jgi:pimeloyl-ACP methyl ester carboxylesterase
MRRIKKTLLRTLTVLLILYVLVCIVIYFFQEKWLFVPEKLAKDYKFSYNRPFEEINIRTNDKDTLNGLIFTSDSSKGLIFYLHGNAGSLSDWGENAKPFTALHYDVFIPDYPGYGKSTGSIKSQKQLFKAMQAAYSEIKNRYDESKIIVWGYSIGTGPAAWVASGNHPKLLILQAPYYSMTDMMVHTCPILPTFLLRYKLQTNEYLKNCRMPVVIFHGDQDKVIYYGSSLKLRKEMKSGDKLITLHGEGHYGMNDSPEFITAIKTILN